MVRIALGRDYFLSCECNGLTSAAVLRRKARREEAWKAARRQLMLAGQIRDGRPRG
eukprot:COSAG04_NODE_24128_length_326_cov_1.145374_1_plen_55_part_10